MKIFDFQCSPMSLGESRAKRSQDDKPLTHQESVRAASVDYAPWSHPSLRSRRGSGSTATWPQLARPYPVPSIPARPFGLGLRYDETPSGSAVSGLRARSFKPTRESTPSLAYDAGMCNR